VTRPAEVAGEVRPVIVLLLWLGIVLLLWLGFVLLLWFRFVLLLWLGVVPLPRLWSILIFSFLSSLLGLCAGACLGLGTVMSLAEAL